MDNLPLAVVALCWRWLQPRHNVEVQFLQAQIRVLRARVAQDLIVRFATENSQWGYRMIVGELQKLRIVLCTSTARNILVEAGLHPTPDEMRRTPTRQRQPRRT